VTCQAVFAMAAKGGQAGDDMVARFAGSDFRSDGFHDACRFMAENSGQRVGI